MGNLKRADFKDHVDHSQSSAHRGGSGGFRGAEVDWDRRVVWMTKTATGELYAVPFEHCRCLIFEKGTERPTAKARGKKAAANG